jgi:hypothetical protein
MVVMVAETMAVVMVAGTRELWKNMGNCYVSLLHDFDEFLCLPCNGIPLCYEQKIFRDVNHFS